MYRNWCATWNNYPEDWESKLPLVMTPRKKETLISYWISGKEIAPETGTPHLQMYIQLTKRQRLKALQKATVKAGVQVHLVPAKGSLTQNQTYCKKEGDFKEGGVPRETDPKLAGRASARVDLEALRDGILGGKTDLELALDSNTLKASASFQKFSQNLRHQAREKEARARAKEEMTDIILRDWQNEAVLNLDECVLPPVQLTWCPSRTGSHFKEFNMFPTHKYSF